jgi:hypothetical protein
MSLRHDPATEIEDIWDAEQMKSAIYILQNSCITLAIGVHMPFSQN